MFSAWKTRQLHIYLIRAAIIFNRRADARPTRCLSNNPFNYFDWLRAPRGLDYQWMCFWCHSVAMADRWLVALACRRRARASAWSSPSPELPTLRPSTPLESHQRRRWRQDALRHIALPRFALPFVVTLKARFLARTWTCLTSIRKTARWMAIVSHRPLYSLLQ